MVEQRTENPRVAGSIPALGIFAAQKWIWRLFQIKRFEAAFFVIVNDILYTVNSLEMIERLRIVKYLEEIDTEKVKW